MAHHHLDQDTTALPPIEYVPSQPVAIPRHISLPSEITKSVMTYQAAGGKPAGSLASHLALPQIDSRANGDLNDEEKKKLLGLEFQGTSSGNSTNPTGSKLTTMAQAQGNIVKVAMYGEFPVTKAE